MTKKFKRQLAKLYEKPAPLVKASPSEKKSIDALLQTDMSLKKKKTLAAVLDDSEPEPENVVLDQGSGFQLFSSSSTSASVTPSKPPLSQQLHQQQPSSSAAIASKKRITSTPAPTSTAKKRAATPAAQTKPSSAHPPTVIQTASTTIPHSHGTVPPAFVPDDIDDIFRETVQLTIPTASAPKSPATQSSPKPSTAHIDLWGRFEAKLKESGTQFDELDAETDWKDLLKELQFQTLEIGVLLKRIKAKLGGTSPHLAAAPSPKLPVASAKPATNFKPQQSQQVSKSATTPIATPAKSTPTIKATPHPKPASTAKSTSAITPAAKPPAATSAIIKKTTQPAAVPVTSQQTTLQIMQSLNNSHPSKPTIATTITKPSVSASTPTPTSLATKRKVEPTTEAKSAKKPHVDDAPMPQPTCSKCQRSIRRRKFKNHVERCSGRRSSSDDSDDSDDDKKAPASSSTTSSTSISTSTSAASTTFPSSLSIAATLASSTKQPGDKTPLMVRVVSQGFDSDSSSDDAEYARTPIANASTTMSKVLHTPKQSGMPVKTHSILSLLSEGDNDSSEDEQSVPQSKVSLAASTTVTTSSVTVVEEESDESSSEEETDKRQPTLSVKTQDGQSSESEDDSSEDDYKSALVRKIKTEELDGSSSEEENDSKVTSVTRNGQVVTEVAGDDSSSDDDSSSGEDSEIKRVVATATTTTVTKTVTTVSDDSSESSDDEAKPTTQLATNPTKESDSDSDSESNEEDNQMKKPAIKSIDMSKISVISTTTAVDSDSSDSSSSDEEDENKSVVKPSLTAVNVKVAPKVESSDSESSSSEDEVKTTLSTTKTTNTTTIVEKKVEEVSDSSDSSSSDHERSFVSAPAQQHPKQQLSLQQQPQPMFVLPWSDGKKPVSEVVATPAVKPTSVMALAESSSDSNDSGSDSDDTSKSDSKAPLQPIEVVNSTTIAPPQAVVSKKVVLSASPQRTPAAAPQLSTTPAPSGQPVFEDGQAECPKCHQKIRKARWERHLGTCTGFVGVGNKTAETSKAKTEATPTNSQAHISTSVIHARNTTPATTTASSNTKNNSNSKSNNKDVKSNSGGSARFPEALTVFIGGLAQTATEDAVRDLLKGCGNVCGVHISLDLKTGRSRGFCFVVFETSEQAEAALILHGSEFMGKTLTISRAGSAPKKEPKAEAKTSHPSASSTASLSTTNSTALTNNHNANSKATNQNCRIFIGGLTPEVTKEALRNLLKSYGNVWDVRISTDPDTNRPKGFGHVEFQTSAQAAAALVLNGTEFMGKNITVSLASAPSRALPSNSSEQRTIFIGGLAHEATRESVRDLVQSYGKVCGVRIAFDTETNQPKGFCHVDFQTPEEAAAALVLHETEFMGSRVSVLLAAPRTRQGKPGQDGSYR